MKKMSLIGTPGGTITVVIPTTGKRYLIAPDHVNYCQITAAIRADNVEALDRLYDAKKAIEAFHSGVKVRDGIVYYNGEPAHNLLTDRILCFMRNGYSHQFLVNFMDKLMLNTSKNSVDQLFAFLDRNGLTIHEDGDFISYKRVRNDWKDFHSGTLDYSIGKTAEVARNKVDDNPDHPCSYGIHVGTLKYVENFHYGLGHVIYVKVNPKDAVAVPKAEADKMRVCRVVSLAEFKGELKDALYGRDACLQSGLSS